MHNLPKKIPLAYLISRYPAVTHTFIQREILSLRAHHCTIHVASINSSDIAPEQQTEVDREEIRSTYYVKKQGPFKALKAVLKTWISHPVTFVTAFFFALRKGGWYHLFYLAEACLVGQWMRKLHIHHLHVHFANPASQVALLVNKLFSYSFSMTVHGPDEFDNIQLNQLKEKIRHADFICCIGFYAQSQLMRLSTHDHWNKFEITRMGVDPTIYSPSLAIKQCKPLEIVCIGRLTPAKGQHVLLAAFRRLIQEGRNVRLRLIGEGPDRKSLEAYVKQHNLTDYVDIAGALNQEQTRAYLQKADIFALASFAEGIPVSLMEAMASEIPCIATSINGIPELIDHGINGLLVSPSDVVAFSRALALLCDDPKMRKTLGQSGRQRILESYHLTTNTERLAMVFQQRVKT